MKLVRFLLPDNDSILTGSLEEDLVHELAGDIFSALKKTGRTFPENQVRLEAPSMPGKIVCIGLNYKDHAAEFNAPLPEEPLIFLKPSTSVIGPNQPIVCPAQSKRVDFEGEFAVVIGKKASRVSADNALDYVLGYTCLNDVTARDLQQKDGQWTRGKGFDTFCPMGPYIQTDIDPHDLAIETRQNGELKQSSRTSNLIFGVDHLIEFISSVMTLEPGDVIATGTPSGVGKIEKGDVIEVRIEGLGVLTNPVE